MSEAKEALQFTLAKLSSSDPSDPVFRLYGGQRVFALFRDNGPVIPPFTKDKGKFANREACWDIIPENQFAIFALELEGHGYPKVYELLQAHIAQVFPDGCDGNLREFKLAISFGARRESEELPQALIDALFPAAVDGFNLMAASRRLHSRSVDGSAEIAAQVRNSRRYQPPRPLDEFDGP